MSVAVVAGFYCLWQCALNLSRFVRNAVDSPARTMSSSSYSSACGRARIVVELRSCGMAESGSSRWNKFIAILHDEIVSFLQVTITRVQSAAGDSGLATH